MVVFVLEKRPLNLIAHNFAPLKENKRSAEFLAYCVRNTRLVIITLLWAVLLCLQHYFVKHYLQKV